MRLRILLFIAIGMTAWAQLPNSPPGSIVNGASFSGSQPISVGSLISIFGTNLSSSLQHADTIPLSTSLGGVTVQFVNGSTTMNAPMLDTIPGANQLNVQVPWNIVPPNAPAQTVNVVVTVEGKGSSQPAPVTIGPFSPGIFTAGPPDFRAFAQNHADGSVAQPVGSIPGLSCHPAKAGDILIIYGTGLGALDGIPPADGATAPAGNQFLNTTKPTVLVGGISAEVIYYILSQQFVGVNEVAVFVPNNAPTGDKVPLQIQAGGITSPNNVVIAIGQ